MVSSIRVSMATAAQVSRSASSRSAWVRTASTVSWPSCRRSGVVRAASAASIAAPAYLARAAPLETLADLEAHNRIGYRLGSTGGTYAWEIRDDGKDSAVVPRGTARVTDPLFALDLALAGVGIAYLFEPLVRHHIRAGALRWLLPDSAIEEPGLFLYFPRRANQAPKLRAFIDAARMPAPRGRSSER